MHTEDNMVERIEEADMMLQGHIGEKYMSEQELLPCPFCRYSGDKYIPEVVRYCVLYPVENICMTISGIAGAKTTHYAVVCDNCGAQGAIFSNPQEAVEAWNTRL